MRVLEVKHLSWVPSLTWQGPRESPPRLSALSVADHFCFSLGFGNPVSGSLGLTCCSVESPAQWRRRELGLCADSYLNQNPGESACLVCGQDQCQSPSRASGNFHGLPALSSWLLALALQPGAAGGGSDESCYKWPYSNSRSPPRGSSQL